TTTMPQPVRSAGRAVAMRFATTSIPACAVENDAAGFWRPQTARLESAVCRRSIGQGTTTSAGYQNVAFAGITPMIVYGTLLSVSERLIALGSRLNARCQ